MKPKYIVYKIISKITHNYQWMIKYFRNAGIEIADSARVYSDITSSESYLIAIGEKTTISFDVSLITHDNSAEKLNVGFSDFFGRITIGNNCFIGARTVILGGNYW